MTRVRIPVVLRTHVGGNKEVDAEGATVGEVLNDLVARHPALGEQLMTADGQLHRFVNVYVDGQDVRYLSGLETDVPARATVIILPAMAGGSNAATRSRA